MGEILVKFSPLANNHIVELLESEGAEAVMPDLMDFLLYCFYNSNFKSQHLGAKKSTAYLCNAGISLLEYFRRTARKELTASKHFTPPAAIDELARMAQGLSLIHIWSCAVETEAKQTALEMFWVLVLDTLRRRYAS